MTHDNMINFSSFCPEIEAHATTGDGSCQAKAKASINIHIGEVTLVYFMPLLYINAVVDVAFYGSLIKDARFPICP